MSARDSMIDIVRERATKMRVKLDTEQVEAIVDENGMVWDRAIGDASEDLIIEYRDAMSRTQKRRFRG